MSLVLSESRSGLVVAHKATGEASVRAALKQHDRALDVEWKRVGEQVCWYVTKQLGGDRPAEWICDWVEDGEPLPLSHGLVQRVKDLDLNSRAPRVDVEALNDRMVAEERKEFDGAIDELSKDVVERLRGRKLHVLPRGAYRRNTRFKSVER